MATSNAYEHRLVKTSKHALPSGSVPKNLTRKPVENFFPIIPISLPPFGEHSLSLIHQISGFPDGAAERRNHSKFNMAAHWHKKMVAYK